MLPSGGIGVLKEDQRRRWICGASVSRSVGVEEIIQLWVQANHNRYELQQPAGLDLIMKMNFLKDEKSDFIDDYLLSIINSLSKTFLNK